MIRVLRERQEYKPRVPSANAPVVLVREQMGYYEPLNTLARSFGQLVGLIYGHHLDTIRDRFGYRVEIQR